MSEASDSTRAVATVLKAINPMALDSTIVRYSIDSYQRHGDSIRMTVRAIAQDGSSPNGWPLVKALLVREQIRALVPSNEEAVTPSKP
jgi:hypothetical protein